MGFRFNKRVGLSKKTGLNLSKSGISISHRSKFGSIGSKGFTIRTGIPGLSFRSTFGSSKKSNEIINFLIFILIVGVFILAFIVLWNLILFLFWICMEIYRSIMRYIYKNKIKRIIANNRDSDNFTFFRFSENSLPENQTGQKIVLANILVENETTVEENTDLAIVKIGDKSATISAQKKGKITFCKFQGEKLKFGDYVFILEE